MKKYKLLFCILLFLIFMSSCKGEFFGPGTADYSYELSGDYKLFHAGETDLWRTKDTNGMKKVVERNITGIAWDSNYILVEQIKDRSVSYWIIDVNENKTYGEFNKSDFESKRKELKVNAELKLEKPEKYKKFEKKKN